MSFDRGMDKCGTYIKWNICCYLVAKSCPTLCDPMDYSFPVSSVHGIFQARILEWLPFPSPGDLPNPGIKLVSPELSGGFFTAELPRKLTIEYCCCSVASVVSDSVRPHGRQPTRLLRPWDFPGKNTGVGCHCLLRSFIYFPQRLRGKDFFFLPFYFSTFLSNILSYFISFHLSFPFPFLSLLLLFFFFLFLFI